jgi:RNA polymerase sigma-70 factor (ECF subfamily)
MSEGRLKELEEVSDERLMERYAGGDGAAFDALFRRYEGRAYAFFYRRTGSEDRAWDLYQELFLRLHRGRSSYDPSLPFAPWLFQIARRLLVDDYRRSFRAHEVAWPERGAPGGEASVERRVLDVEEAQGLLATLSPHERDVLVASKVEGVAYAELAEGLGKSVDAVKKLASRAMQRLRELASAS